MPLADLLVAVGVEFADEPLLLVVVVARYRLVPVRRKKDLAMKQVAGRAGITISMLSCYEHGHSCPTLPNLVNILRALDCSAEEFGSRVGPWGVPAVRSTRE